MTVRPRFSVVLPLFNGQPWLMQTLESLDRQTFRDFDVIVVDDGSTDDGPSIADSHRAVKMLLRQSNRGVAVARNVGVATSTGAYVAFIDQDDLWHPRHLELLAAFIDGTPGVDAIFTSAEPFTTRSAVENVTMLASAPIRMTHKVVDDGSELELLNSEIAMGDAVLVPWARFLSGSVTVTNSFVYRRDVFEAVGGFPTHADAIDDHLLATNVARIAQVWHLDHRSVFYRVHADSALRSVKLAMPLLTSLLAYRNGRVVPGESLPVRLDAQPLIRHEIQELIRQGSRGRSQAIALARLLDLVPEDQWWVRRRCWSSQLRALVPIVTRRPVLTSRRVDTSRP